MPFTPDVCIVGTGRVGLPLGLSFVESGLSAFGLDVDATELPRAEARLRAAGYGAAVGGTVGAGVILLSVLMAAGLQGAAVVATDAVLTKVQANRLAMVAHDGLARSINPVHTAGDGDALFAVATGGSGKPGHLTVLGALAAEVTARAVLNAVRAAHGLTEPDLPCARDLGLA